MVSRSSILVDSLSISSSFLISSSVIFCGLISSVTSCISENPDSILLNFLSFSRSDDLSSPISSERREMLSSVVFLRSSIMSMRPFNFSISMVSLSNSEIFFLDSSSWIFLFSFFSSFLPSFFSSSANSSCVITFSSEDMSATACSFSARLSTLLYSKSFLKGIYVYLGQPKFTLF